MSFWIYSKTGDLADAIADPSQLKVISTGRKPPGSVAVATPDARRYKVKSGHYSPAGGWSDDPPIEYYYNYIAEAWQSPGPGPEYWDDNGTWKEDPPEGEEAVFNRITPEVAYQAYEDGARAGAAELSDKQSFKALKQEELQKSFQDVCRRAADKAVLFEATNEPAKRANVIAWLSLCKDQRDTIESNIDLVNESNSPATVRAALDSITWVWPVEPYS